MSFNPLEAPQNNLEFAATEGPKTEVMEQELLVPDSIEEQEGLTHVEQADLDALNKTIPLYQATIASIEKYSVRDEHGKIPEGEDLKTLEELKGRLKLAAQRKDYLLSKKIDAAESTITAEWWDEHPKKTD